MLCFICSAQFSFVFQLFALSVGGWSNSTSIVTAITEHEILLAEVMPLAEKCNKCCGWIELISTVFVSGEMYTSDSLLWMSSCLLLEKSNRWREQPFFLDSEGLTSKSDVCWRFRWWRNIVIWKCISGTGNKLTAHVCVWQATRGEQKSNLHYLCKSVSLCWLDQ